MPGQNKEEKQMLFSVTTNRWSMALVLLIGPALSAEAHVGGRVFPIPELTDEMLAEIQLDGFVEEWSDLIGEPTLTLLDFTHGGGGGGSLDPSDIDFRIWLAWHDDPARIYAALVVADDVYKNTHTYDVDWATSLKSSMVGGNDSIRLGVDGDHSGGPGFVDQSFETKELAEAELVKVSGKTQMYEAISRTPDGPTVDARRSRYWSGVFSWMALPPFAEAGGRVAGETPVIWSIELYITPFDHRGEELTSPEGSVISDLSADRFIGFAIGVFDEDGRDPHTEPRRLIPEALAGPDHEVFSDMSDFRADNFLDGLLLPAGGTAVESVTWGRIKASLELK